MLVWGIQLMLALKAYHMANLSTESQFTFPATVLTIGVLKIQCYAGICPEKHCIALSW